MITPFPHPHNHNTALTLCSYYEMDDIVMRELVGKKLTNGLRKELEEIKNVKMKTALRQVSIPTQTNSRACQEWC